MRAGQTRTMDGEITYTYEASVYDWRSGFYILFFCITLYNEDTASMMDCVLDSDTLKDGIGGLAGRI